MPTDVPPPQKIDANQLREIIKQNAEAICFQVIFSVPEAELANKITQVLQQFLTHLKQQNLLKEFETSVTNEPARIGGTIKVEPSEGEKLSVEFGLDVETIPIKNEVKANP